MRVTTVEELIIALEGFEPEQAVKICNYRGEPCIKVFADTDIFAVRGIINMPIKED